MTDEPEQSRIILNADRTITIVMDDRRRVVLRPPSIGQFRQVRDRYAVADKEYKDALHQLVIDAGVPGEAQLLAIDVDKAIVGEETSPYAAAFAFMVGVLSDTMEPDPDSLPMWAGRGGVYAVAAGHWRYVQIVPVHEPETAKAAEQTQPYFDPQPTAPEPAAVAPDPPGMAPRFPDPDLSPPAESDGMAPGRVTTPR